MGQRHDRRDLTLVVGDQAMAVTVTVLRHPERVGAMANRRSAELASLEETDGSSAKDDLARLCDLTISSRAPVGHTGRFAARSLQMPFSGNFHHDAEADISRMRKASNGPTHHSRRRRAREMHP
jgi:hypothetical protein